MAWTPHLLVWITVCALSNLQLTNGAANKNFDDPTIVFPGPIQDVSNRDGTADVAEECKDKNFCTVKPDDYPQELFNKIFKGKFKEPVSQPTYVMTGDRQGDPDETNNCETQITYSPIYKVKSREGVWRTVVQAPEENYLQMVRLETCLNVGSPCFTEAEMPFGKPLCKQKNNEWMFLVHDGNEGTEKITVDLPVCCVCYYKNNQ